MKPTVTIIRNIKQTNSLTKYTKTKIVLQVHPIEYKWISNMLQALNQKPNYFQGNDIRNYKRFVKEFPEIDADGHSGGSADWTISIARCINKNGWEIESNDQGLSYTLPAPWNNE